METMPEYWDYAVYWWTSTEADSSNAYTFFASWDGFWLLDTESKSTDLAVTAVRDTSVVPVAPEAAFTTSLLTAPVGTAVDFDASSSSDPDGTIVLYEWDFDGNGIYDATDVTTSHTYLVPGEFIAGLRVTDNDGLTDTATVTLTITPLPEKVIPEVPLGPLIAMATMIMAFFAFVAVPKFHKKAIVNP
jgi:PKD repeat protein